MVALNAAIKAIEKNIPAPPESDVSVFNKSKHPITSSR
jgi:hypothetical protein